MTAGLLFVIAALGFLPRFGFLNVILDPSMFMVGVLWYILFFGCPWRGSCATDTNFEEPNSCFMRTLEQLQEIDEDELQEPSQELDENALQENLEEPLPTQAEFHWISSARSGEIKLTEDVYRAAVQWWLEQQHHDRFDWLSTEDQRLMKPIASSLHHGDVAKARVLLEKVGQLDKMERLSGTQAVGCAIPTTVPLSRMPLSPAATAGQLRKAIESQMLPTGQVSNSPELPHWHMSWKYNRRGLAEHLFAGLRTRDAHKFDDTVFEQCSSENMQMEEGIGSMGTFSCMGA